MNWILPLTIFLLLLALSVWILAYARQLREARGLPIGRVVYEDVSGLAHKPLYSLMLGLSGKPDYLLRDPQGNLIPVEVKSGSARRDKRPYKSHRLQLAAYIVLVEEKFDCKVPYGLIRYRNCTLQLANTTALRTELQATLTQMRRLLLKGQAHRSHQHPQRCTRCSMAHACDESLA